MTDPEAGSSQPYVHNYYKGLHMRRGSMTFPVLFARRDYTFHSTRLPFIQYRLLLFIIPNLSHMGANILSGRAGFQTPRRMLLLENGTT
jgi:hypothetical protein